jgi:hypothetical protein
MQAVETGTADLVDASGVEKFALGRVTDAAVKAVGLGAFRCENRKQFCSSDAEGAAQTRGL